VSILENLGDSFEDAHPFSKMRTKTAHLRTEIMRREKIVPKLALPALERLVFPRLSPIDYTPPPIFEGGPRPLETGPELAN